MTITIHNNAKAIQRTFVYFIAILFLNRVVDIPYVSLNETVANIYTLISQIITIWYIFKFLRFYLKTRNALLSDIGIILFIFLFFFILIFVTVAEGGYVRRAIFTMYPIIGTVCMIEIESKYHAKELLSAFSLFFYAFAILNLIDILITRRTVVIDTSKPFLVGGKNQLAIFLCMTLSFHFAHTKQIRMERRYFPKLKDCLFLLIIILNSILSLSSTCIVTVAVVLFLYQIYVTRGANCFILQPLNILILYTVAWFSLIIFRLQYLFAGLIHNVLHKDLTMSHRTIIWDKALKMIREKPLVGHGLSESYNVFSVHHDYTGGNNDVWTSMSGHNEIIQLLYYGGIIAVIVLIAMYIVSTSVRRRNNSIFMIIFIGVIGILLNWMTEAPGEYSLFLMLAICYWSDRFDVLAESAV